MLLIIGMMLFSVSGVRYNETDVERLCSSKQISSNRGNQEIITEPSSSTVWSHGNFRVQISWSNIEGALVKINLLKGLEPVSQLTGWMDNSGVYRENIAIPDTWGSGSGYSIQIEDNLGNVVTSDNFHIRSNLRVHDTTIAGGWATGQERAPIDWEGAQGTTVRITINRNDELVSEICNWDVNTGHYELPYPVPSSWGHGEGYQIFIEDNLGNSDESQAFSIQPIMITKPLPEATWVVGESAPEFEWFGAANVVRIELRSIVTAHTVLSDDYPPVLFSLPEQTVTEIARWMDDTGHYTPNGSIPSSWAPSRSASYELAVIDDLGMEGVVYPIYIRHTDNTADGAIPLTGTGNERIDSPDDVDYWIVEAARGNKYKVTASDTTTVTLQVLNSTGSSTVTNEVIGYTEWQAARTGNYIIRVSSKLGATGPYSLTFGRVFGSIGN